MKKRAGAGYVLSVAFPVLAIALLGLRLFGPASRWVALPTYALGWTALIFAIVQHPRARDKARRGRRRVGAWLREQIRPLLSTAALLATGWAVWVLLPPGHADFTASNEEALRRVVEGDLERMHRARSGLGRLLNEHAQLFSDPAAVTHAGMRRDLIGAWASYVDYSIELDQLVERHQYFYRIDPFEHPRLNARSFVTGYAALVAQLRAASRLVDHVSPHPRLERLLDDPRPNLGVPAGTYHRLKDRMTRPDTTLRLHAGHSHLSLIEQAGALPSAGDEAAARAAAEDYDTVDRRLKRPDLALDNPLDALERTAFVAWYPVGRGLSKTMASLRLTERDNFVSPEQLARARELLRPGDILLERRNWYLTNVGLPGFWPHAALYVGTLAELDAFAREETRRHLGRAPSEVIRSRYPEVARDLERDDQGHDKRVLEAVGEGVVLTSLEHSGNADYLAALRPRLSRSARVEAILRALDHWGKPYDFAFDFVTDDKLVCSELVYKAYLSPEPERGLSFPLSPAAGRQVLTPNGIAEQFANASGGERQLDFVLFFDGREAEQVAVASDAAALAASFRRPKWDVMQR